MTLLEDIKGIFSRKKPVVVDLSTSQASGLADDTIIEGKPSASRATPAIVDEPEKKGLPSRKSMSHIDVEEVVSMVRQISNHLATQTQRTDKLIECMERLPGALDALPEINRQNSHLLELVGDYLDHARRRDDTLNDTLGGITEASTRQTEVLGLLQQQMDAQTQSARDLRDNLDGFKDAIRDLAGSNARTTSILTDLTNSSEKRETDLQQMLVRSQRWMIAAMVCCAAASLTAIAVAAFAVFGN